MQKIEYQFDATTPLERDVHIGVVGSGDLEILLTNPSIPGKARIQVRTSVDGFDTVWRRVLARFFDRHCVSADYRINDFGATPGMVNLRLSQAVEAASNSSKTNSRRSITTQVEFGPFTELNARERARVVLDPGSFREILGPFAGIESPHLETQGVVPESDDGAVVARGTLNGQSAVVVSLEGKFQGGGIGEISGAKIAGVLERALKDTQDGRMTRVVLLLETGGIRLQEANLGLLAIAEIHAGIIALQKYTPVTAVVAGTVGCFGGMGIAAGLCDHIVMTRGARLGLNGPEVIETEAGVGEIDASDRPAIWSMVGGEQRVASGRAEVLVDDDVLEVRTAVIGIDESLLGQHRKRFDLVRSDTKRLDPEARPSPSALHIRTERSN